MQKYIEREELFIMLTFALFSESACKKEEPQFEYTPFPLEGTAWGDSIYTYPDRNKIMSNVQFSFQKRTHVDVL